MSLLLDHYNKVSMALARGVEVQHGVFIDFQGTLFSMHGVFNRGLLAFVEWNHEKKLLGPNHVFTNGTMGWGMLGMNGFNPENTGVERMESKKSIYSEAHAESRKIALVIDDQDPHKKESLDGTAPYITWWHPDSEDVRKFLEEKQYLDFTP